MGLRFAVDCWAALAPGLSTQQQWLEWFRHPGPVARDFVPDLAWVPAGLRRRVSPLGRAALNVLASCQPPQSCPAVFASRYGDLDAIAGLLAQLHREEVVSPMGFSLSVHNAAMGVYSIARSDRMATTSIAVNEDLAEAACFEALGWLAAGTDQVLVVCCADAVPPPYEVTDGAEQFRHAWACRLRVVASGGISLVPTDGCESATSVDQVASASLRALSFLIGTHRGDLVSGSGRYRWQRHD
jgi:Beta-ketoacyl synthase, N-terminal domain